MEERRRLEKSHLDKVISGVCGGIAEYFGWDAKNVRIAFVVFTLLGGSGIGLYIILIFLMD